MVLLCCFYIISIFMLESLTQLNIFLGKSVIFQTLKFFLGFYLIIMLVTIALVLYRIGRIYFVILASGQEFPNIEKGKFQRRWEKVLEWLDGTDEAKWKAAVLESAMMLDEVLKIIQHSGNNLTQRLAGMNQSQLANLEAVKEADAIKNAIVADESFKISKEEASRVVEAFGRALIFYEAIEE